MASVSLEQVCKQFPDGNVAVDQVDLAVEDREFLVLVGPSGCGKSSTLRMIAGLDSPTSGEIRIGDRVVNDVAPKDRDIAMVFQNYALYPHMSVYKNMAFGLLLRYGGGVLNRGLIRIFQPQKSAKLRRLRSGVDHQVRQAAERLGISHLLDRKPHQLSGGERQRVALGRAIVREPAVFLFDEPLSNLDAKLRQQMRLELKRLHRELAATIVYVTHDQVEAMTMGDRIAVMKDGEILQIGTPDQLYHRPANTFVAQFIGSVPTNLIPQTLLTNDTCRPPENDPRRNNHEQRDLLVGFRAEHAQLIRNSNDDDLSNQNLPEPENTPGRSHQRLRFAATVQSTDRLGDSTLVSLLIDTANAKAVRTTAPQQTTETQFISPKTRSLKANQTTDPDTENRTSTTIDHAKTSQLGELTVRTPGDSHWRLGQRVIVEVEQNRLMWFDPSSGNNLDRENS